jgi:prepilin-type N-terminal cleavage/methylation domain-containing protein
MTVEPKLRNCAAFTLLELLLVITIIGVLCALFLPALRRSHEKAKLAKCQTLLRQFYLITAMYADDNNGMLTNHQYFLQKTPMLCPSDKALGKGPKADLNIPTSFFFSPFAFTSGTRLDKMPAANWMLTELEPYRDLSKKPGFERGKWHGRFLALNVDGSIHCDVMDQ